METIIVIVFAAIFISKYFRDNRIKRQDEEDASRFIDREQARARERKRRGF
jgi:hypothetical protein